MLFEVKSTLWITQVNHIEPIWPCKTSMVSLNQKWSSHCSLCADGLAITSYLSLRLRGSTKHLFTSPFLFFSLWCGGKYDDFSSGLGFIQAAPSCSSHPISYNQRHNKQRSIRSQSLVYHVKTQRVITWKQQKQHRAQTMHRLSFTSYSAVVFLANYLFVYNERSFTI